MFKFFGGDVKNGRVVSNTKDDIEGGSSTIA